MQKVAIIGAGGFAREVLDVFDAANEVGPRWEVLGFLVQKEFGAPGTLVNDLPILGDLDWLEGRTGEVSVLCAVGAPEVRRRLVRQALARSARFCTVVHPGAVLTRWVTLGPGTVVTAGCILTNRITVGAHVHVNLGCTIGHDAVLEDFSTLAPGVHVSGNVSVGEGAYLGTGAVILEKRTLGAWSTVGAGGVVTADVPENATVVGIPGKVVKQKASGWFE